MTITEACRILVDIHTRPSAEHGVIVEMSRMPQRGEEDRYVEAWNEIRKYAYRPGGPR